MSETAQQFNDRIKGSMHVVPVDDLKEHNTFSDYCKCEPRIEWQPNGHRIVVHNSYDGREFWENLTEENV